MVKMLGTIVILLLAALSVEAYTNHDLHERLVHGRQLKIYLPKGSEKLEFSPADDPSRTFLYWERGRSRVSKGRVSGTGSDRRWYIDRVTYEDQGTYYQRDFWNKEISTVRVAVTPRKNFMNCVAGESLYVSLEGIDLADAFLSFSSDNMNVTLVHDGARVSQDIPEYWDRVYTHSMNIEIKHVNYSDVGRYTLKDRRQRVVSVTRMDLIDHHEYSGGNPLLALLLLLGIPAGVCCCCRKKIFKKKPPSGVELQSSPQTVHPPPSGPVGPVGPAGPCPPYNTPGQPGQVFYYSPHSHTDPTLHPPPVNGPGQWSGPPPSPGFNPAYPPPCTGPAMMPPGPAPQWTGPPPAAAPMGYTPAPLYSSAPPHTENPVEHKGALDGSLAEPLLQTAPEGDPGSCPVPPPSSSDGLSSSDGAYTFQIDGGKNSTNFL